MVRHVNRRIHTRLYGCAFKKLSLQMDRLNILWGSSVLTLLCAIHSRSTLGVTFGSGWKLEQLAKSNHFTSFIAPTISCTSIETKWFHVLTLIGYSSHFVSFIQFRSWLVHKVCVLLSKFHFNPLFHPMHLHQYIMDPNIHYSSSLHTHDILLHRTWPNVLFS